jgi:hypothetical protein
MAERLAGAEGLLLIAVLIGVCVPIFNMGAVWPMARQSQTHFGRELLRNPRLNKSTAFTLPEREALGLIGLLPEQIETDAAQVQRVLQQVSLKVTNLDKYIYLSGLQDTNETLFYKVLMSDPAQFMPYVYTPTVGEACQRCSSCDRDEGDAILK